MSIRIDTSRHRSFIASVARRIGAGDASIHRGVHPSMHQSVDARIRRCTNPSMHGIHRDALISRCIDRSLPVFRNYVTLRYHHVV
jgi:hypothetical protein